VTEGNKIDDGKEEGNPALPTHTLTHTT